MLFCIISVILPLISAIFIFFFGRFLGLQTKLFSVINMLIAFISSCFGAWIVISNNITLCWKPAYWLQINSLTSEWGFLFDNLSVLMIFTVTSVSFCVHLYSCYYMETDPHLIRFLCYLSLFTFFMLFLVSSDNFIQFFFAWEGVGICSYLLINFWYTRIEANRAALKAVLINRIGDCALFFSIAITWSFFKTTEFCVLTSLIPRFDNQTWVILGFEFLLIDVIGFGLCIAAFCKSAQIGFHIWLPDAMEGPTPVSALIHAATMVTAGIYLLLRCSIFFELSGNLCNLITVVGALTALLGASTALFQSDIKKIIAYSTCSQLGYMFVSCGISRYDLSLFHLINHAFFKATLFLCAGVIIHCLANEQDLRRMGGLKNKLIFIYSAMLIASFSITGIPFLSGFYSKDAILNNIFVVNNSVRFFSYFVCMISGVFTSFYSAKLLYLVFLTTPRGLRFTYLNMHLPPLLALIPIFILIFISIFSGFYFFRVSAYATIGSEFFDGLIHTNKINEFYGDSEFFYNYDSCSNSNFFYYNNLCVSVIYTNIFSLHKLIPIFSSVSGFLYYSLKC